MDVITIGLSAIGGIIGILLLIGWIYILIKEAKKKDYIWFILTLLIPIVAIIYWAVKLVK